MKYVANKKAWMTRTIFTTWLEEFDSNMCCEKRKVCLLLDNCTGHYVAAVEMTSVELPYIPPNAMSVVQPLDQGIINSVKCAYRCVFGDRVLLNLELKRETKIDIFMATEMVVAAWKGTRQSITSGLLASVHKALKLPKLHQAARVLRTSMKMPGSTFAQWMKCP